MTTKRKVRGRPATSQSDRVYRARADRLERENLILDGKVLLKDEALAELEKEHGWIRSYIVQSSLSEAEQDALLTKLASIKKNLEFMRPLMKSLHRRTV